MLSMPYVWWILAGLLVVAELATGTFYLLMIAVGAVAGALAAHLGVSLEGQIIAAALVGGGVTSLWHFKRAKRPVQPPVAENKDVNLDVGEILHVEHWNEDNTADVNYRGSIWKGRLVKGAAPVAGKYIICSVEGNWLVLAPAK